MYVSFLKAFNILLFQVALETCATIVGVHRMKGPGSEKASEQRNHGGKKIFDVLTAILLVGYPIIVYGFIKYFGVRATALFLIVLLIPKMFFIHTHDRKNLWFIVAQIMGISITASLALVYKNLFFLQQLPVLISIMLFCSFGFTLFKPPSMIERFARLVQEDLTEKECSHCRLFTFVWIGFFLVHALIIETIILTAGFDTWTLYTGVLGYIFMGFIFTGEYIVRKKRFGRYNDGLLDRCLRPLLSSPRKTQ